MLWALFLSITVHAADLCAPFIRAASLEEVLVKLETADLPDPSDCLTRLIEANKWESALALSSHYADKNIPLSESLKTKAVESKKKVEKLLQALDHNGAKVQVVSPAFQWAQSPDTVYLDVKFSHRFDSPGCLELGNRYVNITDTHLRLGALCTYSSHRMKYQLEFEFFAPVNSSASAYSFASKGRCSVTLPKNETAAWNLPMKGKKPPNMQIWWEMKERYQKKMNKLTGEKDDDELRDRSGLGDLLDNPNVVIKDSFVNGKKYDNSKEREQGS